MNTQTTNITAIDSITLDAADPEAAQRFYADAFGWSFNDYGPGYAGIRSPDGSGEVGGLNGEGASPAGGRVSRRRMPAPTPPR